MLPRPIWMDLLEKMTKLTKRWPVLLVLNLFTGFLLVSCAETAQNFPVEVDPRFGGVFHYASSTEPLLADSQCDPNLQMHPLQTLVMESLVAFGEGYSVVPMLAESWEVSHNDTMYTFYLRRGVKFHNGKEMTSEDVIASLERYFSEGYRASAFEVIQSYKALDDYSIRIQVSRPTAALLYNLALPEGAVHIYPKEIIQGRPQNDLTWDELIGTGPYQLAEHTDGRLVLKRFEDYQTYPGQQDGLGGAKIAFFDEIHFHVVPEGGERLAGLKAGIYDWIEGEGQYASSVEADPDLQVVWDDYAGANHLLFNHSMSPTNDPLFRRAIRALLDMEEFGLAVWEACNQCFQMNYSLWPVFSNHYINDPYSRMKYHQRNPGKARALMNTSSYTGRELVCIASTGLPPSLEVCDYLQEILDLQLAIDVRVELLPPDDFQARINDGGWHFTMMVFPNAMDFYPSWYATDNSNDSSARISTGYSSEAMETAIAHIESATTFEARLNYLMDIQHIAYEDAIDVKLWDVSKPWFHRSNIKGYESWSIPRFYGIWRE